MVALPSVALFQVMRPPLLTMVALPAVLVSRNQRLAAPTLIVALPAVLVL